MIKDELKFSIFSAQKSELMILLFILRLMKTIKRENLELRLTY